jgi:hypothetical protein
VVDVLIRPDFRFVHRIALSLMKTQAHLSSRRVALSHLGSTVAAFAITIATSPMAQAADNKKPKRKAAKEDFFFQEEPGEKGKRCETCINFEPTTGDKGTCALLEGEVCNRCFCQGWSDIKSGKKANT